MELMSNLLNNMVHVLNKKIPIDIYSKKRLIFNVVLHGSYIIIFALSYIISFLITYSFSALYYNNLQIFFNTFLLIVIVKFFIFNFLNFKRFLLYTSELYDIVKISIMVSTSSLIIIGLRLHVDILSKVPVLLLFLDTVISLSAIIFFNSVARFLYGNRNYFKNIVSNKNIENDSRRTLIIGADKTAQILLTSLKNSTYNVVGYVTDDPKRIGMRFQGIQIYGPIDSLLYFSKKKKVNQVIIASYNGTVQKKRIVELIKDTDIDIATVPSYTEIIKGNVRIDNIRHIEIEELLKRDKVEIDMNSIFNEISQKTVLITGAAGSIGSQLCRYILKFNPKVLILLDQAETPLFYLEKGFCDCPGKTKFVPIIADIVDSKRIFSVFEKYRPNIVLHAAAYKHVPMMENNFVESIVNNVKGTKNLADKAEHFKTEHFIMISTDKAVNPTSIMGMSKRIAEIYIQSLNQVSETKYITVRFGNVLDSGGNVIEIFKKQIAAGGPVTVTHPEMRRYFMLTSEAVQLVLQAGMSGKGGEIFMLDMGEPINIVDLAKSMIKISGFKVGKDIEIKFTGIRPGEKLFEELQHDGENYCATSYKKIFVLKCRENNWKYTKSQIDVLINNVYDVEATVKIIGNLVPEYHPPQISLIEA